MVMAAKAVLETTGDESTRKLALRIAIGRGYTLRRLDRRLAGGPARGLNGPVSPRNRDG